MGGKFTLDSAGLSPLADIHSQVADGLSQLTGAGAPQAADVARSFGNIAFAVNTALDGVTQSRGSTIQTTKGGAAAVSAPATTVSVTGLRDTRTATRWKAQKIPAAHASATSLGKATRSGTPNHAP